MSVLVACSNAFDPFAEDTSNAPFYLFGYLDTEADTQFVRVQAIRATFDSATEITSDARVSSTVAGSGRSLEWQKRRVLLTDDSYGHVFFAPIRVEPGDEFHLEVRRNDGAASTSRTRVPTRPEPLVDSVRTEGGSLSQSIAWIGAERRPLTTRVTYHVSRSSADSPIPVQIDHGLAGRMERGQYVVNLPLSADRSIIAQRVGATPADSPALYGIEMSIQIPSEEWLNTSADHVDRGVGFLGALATFETHWILPEDIVAMLEMEDRQSSGESETGRS